jgi:hypothetical protein
MTGFWIRNCHSIYDVDDANLDSPLDNCQNLKKKYENAQKYFKLKNRLKKISVMVKLSKQTLW